MTRFVNHVVCEHEGCKGHLEVLGLFCSETPDRPGDCSMYTVFLICNSCDVVYYVNINVSANEISAAAITDRWRSAKTYLLGNRFTAEEIKTNMAKFRPGPSDIYDSLKFSEYIATKIGKMDFPEGCETVEVPLPLLERVLVGLNGVDSKLKENWDGKPSLAHRIDLRHHLDVIMPLVQNCIPKK